MRRLTHGLDATAIGLGGLGVGILASGGWTVAGWRLTRPEDVVVALALVIGARALIKPIRLPHVNPERAVTLGAVAYVVLMSFIVVTRHQALRTHALDLGYYVQVVWSIGAGYGAQVTLPPMHAWGDHFSPVLYFFVPAAWIWPGAAPLLIAQTVILAAGAIAFFQLSWLRLRDRRVAAAAALLYLLNPSLHGINLRDIHPQAFVIPLVIGAALAFDARRYGWCAAALVVTLACREDATVAVVGFAIWLAVARGRWIAGAVVAALSVTVLVADMYLVMPYFRGGPYPHLGRYAHLGGSLGEILLTVVARPWRWIGVVVSGGKILYVAALLAPLGFLPLLGPRALAGALPGLAMNLASFDHVLFHYRTQYQSFVLPFLFLAALDGYRRLRAWVARRKVGRRFSPARALALGFIASTVLTARTTNDLAVTSWLPGPFEEAAYVLLARVPPGAAVSANERLHPHLATRREAYVFPAGLPASEYILDLRTAGARVPAGYVMETREGPWALWRRRVLP